MTKNCVSELTGPRVTRPPPLPPPHLIPPSGGPPTQLPPPHPFMPYLNDVYTQQGKISCSSLPSFFLTSLTMTCIGWCTCFNIAFHALKFMCPYTILFVYPVRDIRMIKAGSFLINFTSTYESRKKVYRTKKPIQKYFPRASQ